MYTVFKYTDRTEDELMVDVVPPVEDSIGHPRPLELMFSAYNHSTGSMVSVLLPIEQVLKLMTVCRIEIDAIRPEPEDLS